jgi:hypothetical protein
MIEWLLIFQLMSTPGQALTQFGPYKSEAACAGAAQQMKDTFRGMGRWVCTPTQVQPKP